MYGKEHDLSWLPEFFSALNSLVRESPFALVVATLGYGN